MAILGDRHSFRRNTRQSSDVDKGYKIKRCWGYRLGGGG